jgi:hypothetical protein
MAFYLDAPSLRGLHGDPFHRVQADLIVTQVIELGGAGRCVISHGRCVLQRAAVFQIGSNPGRAERVVTNLRVEAGRNRSARHHRVSIGLGQGGGAKVPRAALNGAKQRPLALELIPAPSMCASR